jgi:hypothetical protein
MVSNQTDLLSSTSLGNSQTHTENGVGTELGLVGGTVEIVKKLVNLGLVLNIDALLDQSRGDDGVDVVNGLVDTLATPLGLVSIAKLASLVLTCFPRLFLTFRSAQWGGSGRTGRGTGRDNSAVQTRLGNNVDLDGRVATGVVDVTGVNLADRHVEDVG